MTASAESVNLELRIAFAKVATYVIRGLRRVDLLLGLLAAEQSGPRCLKRLLHVHVRAGQLAAPFQDLGVHPVRLEQALAHAQRFEAVNRVLELPVSARVVTAKVSDPAQRDVGFGDGRRFLEAGRQL